MNYRLITKICDKLKCLNRHRSKSIRVTSLFFCQNDVLKGGPFWQKDSFVTLLLFDLCLSKHFSLSQIFVITLSLKMISRVFSYKCRLIHNFHFWSLRGLYFENLSYRCQHKYDLTISRTFGSHFWRILTFGPTVCPSPA